MDMMLYVNNWPWFAMLAATVLTAYLMARKGKPKRLSTLQDDIFLLLWRMGPLDATEICARFSLHDEAQVLDALRSLKKDGIVEERPDGIAPGDILTMP